MHVIEWQNRREHRKNVGNRRDGTGNGVNNKKRY